MQRVLISFVLFFFSTFLYAQAIPALQYASLGDLRLENGAVIHDCRIGYRTLGILNAAKSNAVLVPAWFTGGSGDVTMGLGPGSYIDTSKYFVIAVDPLGNGISSSPSNSATQHGTDFPQFSIRDMVESEYRFVTETLHLEHLHAVMGISMGGLQTFQWMVSHPDFMDVAVPIVGTPQMSSYDLLLWNTELKALESDPAYNHGKYTQRPALSLVALIHNMNLSTPNFRANHTTREGFQQYFEQIVTDGDRFFDANDYLRQLQALIGHDIAHGGPIFEAANKVKAKVLIVTATQDHMVNSLPPLGFAKLIHAQTLLLESDCGHMSPGCETARMNPVVERFLEQKQN
ncbi:alpha/beta fold hydrolase [Acidobacterium sp. S8]|uniref:alpha/beta fold hydrolase n=1 Tax=Acidobacterium sp. S8 TaxID=1641854 RepID=UPI00131BD25D|nr:alpha/beta fold hydrolase [Acidobacterium sp. S8]